VTEAPSLPAHLTTEEAADYLRLKPSTLEAWRAKGKGPAYSTLGSRVIYTQSDLDTFVAANRQEKDHNQ